MSDFYLFFWGLICHIGDPANPSVKTHASLAKGPHHERQLVFQDRAVPLTTNVEFVGGLGTATPNDDFIDVVPSLQRLLGSTHSPKADVRNRVSNANVAHHVSYPVSANVTLGVANLYNRFGIYVRGNTTRLPRLVARITYAHIETTANELRFTFNGITESLTPSKPCVLIANAEDQPDTNNDFQHYGVLLDTGPNAGQMRDGDKHDIQVPFPSDCAWVLEHVRNAATKRLEAALSTECGNTQWP